MDEMERGSGGGIPGSATGVQEARAGKQAAAAAATVC
jgi:hypothetical protein